MVELPIAFTFGYSVAYATFPIRFVLRSPAAEVFSGSKSNNPFGNLDPESQQFNL